MSAMDINKLENEEEKSIDKKKIEAEEKEMMLKAENEKIEPASDSKTESGGPVKAALSSEITEQGREVKPKFIPIGAIKMPGFFTKNSDKVKQEEDGDNDGDIEKQEGSTKAKRNRFLFLHTCPITQFMHRPKEKSEKPKSKKDKYLGLAQFFNIREVLDQEAALASTETLEDKLDGANDGMETVKLDAEGEAAETPPPLPLRERIRQGKLTPDDVMGGLVISAIIGIIIICILVMALVEMPIQRPLRLGRYMTTITSCGPVEGILDDGVYKFYGIPFAAPPVGKRRFTYAQPLNNISMCWNDTLQTHEPVPLCLQFLDNGTITGSEDCLTLDIITPDVTYDSPLPVVVLIGANSLSGGISPAQPSALYARTKEVVFVRPNFRLGSFGFLALDILSQSKYPPTSGNYALSDLIVALEWIKNNIRHFGGDATSVTLLGHRAGATLTAALTTVHKAQKLYTRVWLASPSVIFPGETLDVAEKNNEQFKTLSKCTDVECLRRISPTEVLTATPDTWFSAAVDSLPTKDEAKHSWLVLDGDMLRVHAYESWDAQKEAKESGKNKVYKPMIWGTTEHSANSDRLKMKHLNWSEDIVAAMVHQSVLGEKKNLTSELFTHYNKTYEGLVALISSVRTLCPLVSLARLRLSAPMYVVVGAGAGVAGINSDVEAILGTFDSETAQQRRFMSAMQQLFYYFVWHGQLAGPDSPLLAVGQDLLPINKLPACDLLIREDIVPRYAHID